MAKKVETKEKPTPKECVCGKDAVIVKKGSKKMVTCPDPLNCTCNIRTTWMASQDEAIVKWNGLIDSFYHQRNLNGG